MNIAQRIAKYKAAFYNDTARGNVLYVPDLNFWFANAQITRDGDKITLTGTTLFFESDPFTVMPELPARLKLAIEAAGYPALDIAITPTEHKITYSYENDAGVEAGSFLMSLRHYVKQGFKIQQQQKDGIQTQWPTK